MALVVLLMLASLGIAACAYLRPPKFGRLPEGEFLEVTRRSPNHTGEEFRNQEMIPLLTGNTSQAAKSLQAEL